MLSFFPPAPLRSSCFRELSHLIWLCGRFFLCFSSLLLSSLAAIYFHLSFSSSRMIIKNSCKMTTTDQSVCGVFFLSRSLCWNLEHAYGEYAYNEFWIQKKNENNEVCRKSHCFGIEIAKAMSVENGWTTDRCYDFRWEYRTKVSWWNFMEIYQTQPTLFRAIQFHHFNHIHQTIRMIAFFFAYNVPPSF